MEGNKFIKHDAWGNTPGSNNRASHSLHKKFECVLFLLPHSKMPSKLPSKVKYRYIQRRLNIF